MYKVYRFDCAFDINKQLIGNCRYYSSALMVARRSPQSTKVLYGIYDDARKRWIRFVVETVKRPSSELKYVNG